jgi:hypothetical protein
VITVCILSPRACRIVKVTRLVAGQTATVLQLPAAVQHEGRKFERNNPAAFLRSAGKRAQREVTSNGMFVRSIMRGESQGTTASMLRLLT